MTESVGAVLWEAPWIDDRARSVLHRGWLDDWPDQLVLVLDESWPGWPDAGDHERAAWLTGFVAATLWWVTDEQDLRLRPLDQRHGGRGWLPTTLDARYPPWRTAPPDDLVQLIDALLAVAELTWVTAAQATQLDTLWELRGDWHEWLPAELDARWPQWLQSTPDDLAVFLEQLVPILCLPDDTDDTDTDAVDTLTWVTGAQADQLDQLHEIRGDWHDWLPDQLDQWWPQWRGATGAVLASWLDPWLPSLFLTELTEQPPAQPAAPAKREPDLWQTYLAEVVHPVLRHIADTVAELSASRGLSAEETRQVIEQISDDALVAMFTGALDDSADDSDSAEGDSHGR